MFYNLCSLSDEEVETIDSLDIKPPQAHVLSQKMKKRDIHESKTHHKKSDRHREERGHSHRSKHHREKQREREHYQREKERYYKEKQSYDANYKEGYGDMQYLSERAYRERKEDMMRSSRHSDLRKFEERKLKESREIREVRYYRDSEKHRREKYEDERKERGDKTLQDLRERLISKRSIKEEDFRPERMDLHKEKRLKDDIMESAFQGEAGMLVKEIIDISTSDERRYKREEKLKDTDRIIDEERMEQELRRDKLLEAGRRKYT